MNQLDYPLYGNLASLDTSARRLVIRRMLSLTRASKSASERAALQNVLNNFSPSPQTGKEISSKQAAAQPTWQLFARFSYLWIKELFR
jgi:hypothetical protein